MAIPAAAVLGAIALVPRRFEYWRYWTRGPFRWALLAYIALNASSGALGVLLGSVLKWDPSDSKVLSGLAFALAGQAVLRFQLRAFGAERIGGASSLLSLGMERVADWLDLVARERIQKRLEGQADDAIAGYALYLFGRHVEPDPAVAQRDKQTYMVTLVEAGERVDSDPRARGTLEEFCAREIEERQLFAPGHLPDSSA